MLSAMRGRANAQRLTAMAVASAVLAGVAAAGPLETFLVVSEATPSELRKAVGEALEAYLSGPAEPGEAVTVIEAPSHRHVRTIVVPPGATKARLRRREFQRELNGLSAFFLADPGPSDQLKLFGLPESIQNLRLHRDSRCQVVLVGDPVFMDKHYAGWNMATKEGFGAVPGDFTLQRGSGSPFAAGLVSLPRGTAATWLTRETLWGAGGSIRHRQSVIRFYRLWFESQNGARLARFTTSPAKAFDFEPDSDFVRIHARAGNLAMRLVSDRSVQVEPEPNPDPDEVEVTPPVRVAPTGKSSRLPGAVWTRLSASPRLAEVTLVRIRYLADQSDDTSTDVDLRVVNRSDGREAWFEEPSVDGLGRLLNDIRFGVDPAEGSAELGENYEVFRMAPGVAVEDVTVWVNKYLGVDRVEGEVSVMVDGRVVAAQPFVFESAKGDLGTDADNRAASANWKSYPLSELIGQP